MQHNRGLHPAYTFQVEALFEETSCRLRRPDLWRQDNPYALGSAGKQQATYGNRARQAGAHGGRWQIAVSPKTLELGRRRQPAQSSARAFVQDEIARKGEYSQIRGAHRSYVVGQQRRTGAC